MADKKITEFPDWPLTADPRSKTYFVLASGDETDGQNYRQTYVAASNLILSQAAGGLGQVLSGDSENIYLGGLGASDTRQLSFQIGGSNKLIISSDGDVKIAQDLIVTGIISGASGIFEDSLTLGGVPVLTGYGAVVNWFAGDAAGDIYYDDGDVGIGLSNPQHTLHVSGGGVRVTAGGYELVNLQGAVGQPTWALGPVAIGYGTDVGLEHGSPYSSIIPHLYVHGSEPAGSVISEVSTNLSYPSYSARNRTGVPLDAGQALSYLDGASGTCWSIGATQINQAGVFDGYANFAIFQRDTNIDGSINDFSDLSAALVVSTGFNVGIGETNPTGKLHIGGTPGVDGITFPDGTSQTTAAGGGGGGSSPWTVDVSNIYYSAGQVGIGQSDFDQAEPAQLSISGGANSLTLSNLYPNLKWHSVNLDNPDSSYYSGADFALTNIAGAEFALSEKHLRGGALDAAWTIYPLRYETGAPYSYNNEFHVGCLTLGVQTLANDHPSGTLRVHGSGVCDSLYVTGTDGGWMQLTGGGGGGAGGVAWSDPPPCTGTEGTAGDIAYDTGWFYVCVANDSWKRASLETWECGGIVEASSELTWYSEVSGSGEAVPV